MSFMSDKIIGVALIFIGVVMLFVELRSNTFQKFKNEYNWSERFNIYEIYFGIIGFIVAGIYILLK